MITFDREPDYPMRTALISLHVALIPALVYAYFFDFHVVSWVLFSVLTIGGGLGVSIGYHRMLTHRSLACTNFYINRTLIYFAGLLQNAQSWVAHHRCHHAYTDTIDDPHSPYCPYSGGVRGFFWSHIGWLGWKYKLPQHMILHPDLRQLDILWEHKWHGIFVASGFFLPFIIGGAYGIAKDGWHAFFLYGIDSFFLAGVIRALASLHVTCSINSFGHMIGFHARKLQDCFRIKDSSRNNPLLALVSFGEGNHGDHHKYQNSARIGWFDPSWPVILFFEWLGIFTKIMRPPWMSEEF